MACAWFKKYLHWNHLHTAFLNDRFSSPIKKQCFRNHVNIVNFCRVWLHLFVIFRKATLLNNFYQYGGFISSLHHIQPENKHNGFLAFVRLIGTNYFIKHMVAFISSYKHETLKQLFNSLNPSLDPAAKHRVWLQEIRSVANNRITTEEEKAPSYTSLWQHWLWSYWVTQLWKTPHFQMSIHPFLSQSTQHISLMRGLAWCIILVGKEKSKTFCL